MREFYDKHFLAIEGLIVCALGVVFGLWTFVWGGDEKLNTLLARNRGQVYGTVASITGSLLGFAITAMSIVWPATSHPRMKAVRESPHYKTLWRVFSSAIGWLGFTTAVALAALIFDRDKEQGCDCVPWLTVLCAFGMIGCLFRVWRVAGVLGHVVTITAKPEGTAPTPPADPTK